MLDLAPALQRIVRDLHAAGYRALIAGGAVRDALLGLDPKDIDIEVYGIAYDALVDFLKPRGRVDLVGKSFGVVKFRTHGHNAGESAAPDGDTYDFSVPRRDSKTGPSHRDFLTSFDPSITPQEAVSRRDFTINAMVFDPIGNELLDFFG